MLDFILDSLDINEIYIMLETGNTNFAEYMYNLLNELVSTSKIYSITANEIDAAIEFIRVEYYEN